MHAPLSFLLGLASGYAAVTIAESFLHANIHHATVRFRRLQRRFPRLLGALSRAYYSHHVIHHYRTYRVDHVTQFRSPEEQEALDQDLRQRGETLAIRERYGLTLSPRSMVLFVVPVAPFALTALGLGSVFFAGFVVPLTIYPMMSRVVHPYLHMPYENALRAAPPWLRRLLETAYMRRVWRHHWVHHRDPRYNFNLLLGGDWLRGVHREPTSDELREMSRLGLPEVA